MITLFEISGLFVVILVTNIVAYLIAVVVTIYTYWKYRHIGHAWMAFTFSAFMTNYVIRTMVNFVPAEKQQLVWFFQNIAIMLGVWGLILSSLISQFDRLPMRANLISVLVGVLIGLFADSDNVVLKEDEFGINAQYSSSISIFSVILTLLFLAYIYRPLIIKIRRDPSIMRQSYFITLFIGYTLVTLWALIIVLTSNPFVRSLRPLIFAIGILFWGISILLNPISLALTPTVIEHVIVSDKAGIPLVTVDIKSSKNIDSDLLTPLISAVKLSMENFIGSDDKLKTIYFQNSLLTFISGQHVNIMILLNGEFSSNIELLGRYYLEEFENRYHDRLNVGAVDTGDFEGENERIVRLVKSISIS